MEKFKRDNSIEFSTSIRDFDRYKICDKHGYYLDDVLEAAKQTKEILNIQFAEKDLIFTLRSKPSNLLGLDTDYLIKVENQEGKEVANCKFNILNKKILQTWLD